MNKHCIIVDICLFNELIETINVKVVFIKKLRAILVEKEKSQVLKPLLEESIGDLLTGTVDNMRNSIGD